MPLSPRFGRDPLTIEPREDPGEDIVGSHAWITAQVFSHATPRNMDTARLTADGYRRTLDTIRRLPSWA